MNTTVMARPFILMGKDTTRNSMVKIKKQLIIQGAHDTNLQ